MKRDQLLALIAMLPCTLMTLVALIPDALNSELLLYEFGLTVISVMFWGIFADRRVFYHAYALTALILSQIPVFVVGFLYTPSNSLGDFGVFLEMFFIAAAYLTFFVIRLAVHIIALKLGKIGKSERSYDVIAVNSVISTGIFTVISTYAVCMSSYLIREYLTGVFGIIYITLAVCVLYVVFLQLADHDRRFVWASAVLGVLGSFLNYFISCDAVTGNIVGYLIMSACVVIVPAVVGMIVISERVNCG